MPAIAFALLTLAAVPLAIWAATVFQPLRTLGVTAVGTTMALASASRALCGLITWTSAETAHLADPGVEHGQHDVAAVRGGQHTPGARQARDDGEPSRGRGRR